MQITSDSCGGTKKQYFPLLLLTTLFSVSLAINFSVDVENVFSVLSVQFIEGKLYLPEVFGDASLYRDRYFWPLGPLPSLVLIPANVIFRAMGGTYIPHPILNIFSLILIIIFSYSIARGYGFGKLDSIWLTIALVYASVFFLSAYLPSSWNIEHTLAFLFGLVAYKEHMGKNRHLIIGSLHGLVLMARFTAGLGVVFYILRAIGDNSARDIKLKKLVALLLPVALSGTFLLCYNRARFNNWFDNGYTTTNNWVEDPLNYRYELTHYGLFDIRNIPTNVYYYFINMPSPVLEEVKGFRRSMFKTTEGTILHLVPPYLKVVSPGVSFFVVAPLFLLIFRNRLASKSSLYAGATSVVILALLLSYYWPGWVQIGPRYLIDILPFLFVILLESFTLKRISQAQKLLITTSSFFNLYLFVSCFIL